jgi:hypothetical protein
MEDCSNCNTERSVTLKTSMSKPFWTAPLARTIRTDRDVSPAFFLEVFNTFLVRVQAFCDVG